MPGRNNRSESSSSSNDSEHEEESQTAPPRHPSDSSSEESDGSPPQPRAAETNASDDDDDDDNQGIDLQSMMTHEQRQRIVRAYVLTRTRVEALPESPGKTEYLRTLQQLYNFIPLIPHRQVMEILTTIMDSCEASEKWPKTTVTIPEDYCANAAELPGTMYFLHPTGCFITLQYHNPFAITPGGIFCDECERQIYYGYQAVKAESGARENGYFNRKQRNRVGFDLCVKCAVLVLNYRSTQVADFLVSFQCMADAIPLKQRGGVPALGTSGGTNASSSDQQVQHGAVLSTVLANTGEYSLEIMVPPSDGGPVVRDTQHSCHRFDVVVAPFGACVVAWVVSMEDVDAALKESVHPRGAKRSRTPTTEPQDESGSPPPVPSTTVESSTAKVPASNEDPRVDAKEAPPIHPPTPAVSSNPVAPADGNDADASAVKTWLRRSALPEFPAGEWTDLVRVRPTKNSSSHHSSNAGPSHAGEIEDCSICMDAMAPGKGECIMTKCGHQFHTQCLHAAFRTDIQFVCPLCRESDPLAGEGEDCGSKKDGDKEVVGPKAGGATTVHQDCASSDAVTREGAGGSAPRPATLPTLEAGKQATSSTSRRRRPQQHLTIEIPWEKHSQIRPIEVDGSTTASKTTSSGKQFVVITCVLTAEAMTTVNRTGAVPPESGMAAIAACSFSA